MLIAHNGTCTMYCNLLTDIRIARETGYDGIEIIGSKLKRYLDQGYTVEDLLPHLRGLQPVSLGYVQDIERQEPDEYQALLRECEEMCGLAQSLGIPQVQILTGPIGPGVGEFGGYQGLMGRDWPEVRDLTARNLAVISQIGRQHGVSFYLEMLSWTPVHTLKHGCEVIDCAGADNVGVVIDFWHLWTSGITPDEVARLDKRYIAGVHFCDSLPAPPGSTVVSHDLRHVWTGSGHIPLKEWVDAVVATGYDGWWACELFSPKHWELDPWQTARRLRELLEYTLI
jgi:sugar phosphate isomerase/epimerase